MMQLAQALHRFFSSFGLPAYAEGAVPHRVKPPYITYTIVEPDWRDTASMQARVWYRATDYTAISAKVDEIRDRIGEGCSVKTASGLLWLNKGAPFAQFQPMLDAEDKVAYLNIDIQALTA